MATGAAMRNKVTALLRKVNATSKAVFFREITVVGGDSLLGVGGTVTLDDVLMDPQPAVDMVPGDMVATSGGLYQMGDYKLLMSGDIDEATLRNRKLVYGTDELSIKSIDPVVYGGLVVAWQVVARTVSPGDA